MMPFDEVTSGERQARGHVTVRARLPVSVESRQSLRAVAAAAWDALSGQPSTSVLGSEPEVALAHADALHWMAAAAPASVHGVVTDPPYGLIEYQDKDHAKMRMGRGGVWRIPPSFDGVRRSPLPRFTVLTPIDRERLETFFGQVARQALRILVPGGHLVLASNPLLSSTVFAAVERAGFEKRGEIIRLVQTLRGGDRPKGAEDEFQDVSVMPRSGWEPWGLFRKPISEKTVAANLRRWGTGGFRRISGREPFRDVVISHPTREAERKLSPHPSLKPQRFMRQLVHAVLPVGEGLIYDPFAGGGSTLAAAHRLGVPSIGTELDPEYLASATAGIVKLSAYNPVPIKGVAPG